jgi:hypothetical protein
MQKIFNDLKAATPLNGCIVKSFQREQVVSA